MRKLIIAIDGPVGSGKSTVARRVAELLGYVYLESGAMYRALAVKALRCGVALDSAGDLEALARATRIDLQATANGTRVLLDGADVTGELRRAEISHASSVVSQHAGVRRLMVAEQRRAGQAGGVVMEGRDIGTAVFPEAEVKVFLDASPEVRAERRLRDHQARGEPFTHAQVLEEIRERDRRDRERDVSPLVRAPDAVYVDSSALEAEEVARLIVLLARERQRATSVG